MKCGYNGDRTETLIAYLYDDIEPRARAAFDTHLLTCDLCRGELDAMRGVRTQLAHWVPPEPRFAVATSPPPVAAEPVDLGRRAWWREIPAWAQVAAALLVLAVALGVANVEVRYDANGFAVRTGWSTPPAAQPSASTQDAASKADLTALEQQMRAELRAVRAAQAALPAGATARPASDADLLRRVRVLIDEAERRQQNELALRLGQAIRDVSAQRQADLRRIDHSLTDVQDRLGVEVFKTRQTVNSLNYLVRTNQRQ
jgi:hypothetical protein